MGAIDCSSEAVLCPRTGRPHSVRNGIFPRLGRTTSGEHHVVTVKKLPGRTGAFQVVAQESGRPSSAREQIGVD
jgi:hypothetical protein